MDPEALEGPGDPDDGDEAAALALRPEPRSLPLSALSAFSYVPPRRQDPEEHSYFQRQGQVGGPGVEGTGCPGPRVTWGRAGLWGARELTRLRDPAVTALEEATGPGERKRTVGVLTSSVYGKRIQQRTEPLNRGYGRVNHVQADFYRKNDIPSIKEPGFGHIEPA
ncbi:uncharacterized protein C5orf49 homolog [Octodon degus]|uniref:Uncharacterized protein C5orf49 homolog n=1 Tax=Octodon degus TaxID=10160 RepID=A0A6P6DKJ2_OCTDE|nr:uncharacterized protein C5orf49 homolog [Octodon degus]